MSLCFSLCIPWNIGRRCKRKLSTEALAERGKCFRAMDGCEQGSRIPTVDYSDSGCSRY